MSFGPHYTVKHQNLRIAPSIICRLELSRLQPTLVLKVKRYGSELKYCRMNATDGATTHSFLIRV